MAEEKCSCVALLRDFLLLLGRLVLCVTLGLFSSFIPKSKKDLKDDIVLVTGAGQGLGRELARKFASLGATVVLWDINEKSMRGVEKEIQGSGGRVHAYVCDVSDYESVTKVGNMVRQDVGDVTLLVNNAGILQNKPFLELDPAKIRKTLEVNTMAHFWTTKFFLPKMVEMDKGHVVAVSSFAGFVGWLYMADYCASKFAVIGMMESIEEEIRLMGKSEKIHFTTACPVTIDTGLNHNPTTRLPWLVPILSTEYTATDIVNAVQRNERIVTIPRRVYYPLTLQRLFPRKVTQLILDFLEYNIIPNGAKVIDDAQERLIVCN